jgi:replication initiation and membrane attachment protein DnaB
MKLAETEHKNRMKKKETKKVSKKETVPVWIDKEFEVKESTEEEINRMEEMISRVVK